MKKNKKKTMNRRSQATCDAIKEAFLEVKKYKEYPAVTVADICRSADICRGTFYWHYKDMEEVIDDILDDIFLHLPSGKDVSHYICSMCGFIQENTKYHCIFMDRSLFFYSIDRIAVQTKDILWESAEGYPVKRGEELDMILYFQISGCFMMMRRSQMYPQEQWDEVLDTIDQFMGRGIQMYL